MGVEANGAAYNTVKDVKIPDTFRATGIYDPNDKRIDRRAVAYQTLLKGLQYVQEAGYDRAVIQGASGAALVSYVSYAGSNVATERSRLPGFNFVIRGYKPGGEAPPNAKPIPSLIENYSRQAAAPPAPQRDALTSK